MAWIYLAESEESQSLLAIGSDLSHTAKLTHTVKEFCSPEWLSTINPAPIWTDIKTFVAEDFTGCCDIITGGFPCQDISVAGLGKGLAGERSGLFFEIVRFAKEIKPKFIFLENVPAILTRGGSAVVKTITEMGYDCRWCVISASSVGALHRRERWFLLAHSNQECESGLPVGKSQENTCSSLSCNDGNPSNECNEARTYTVPQRNSKETWGDAAGECGPFISREHWQAIVSEMDKCSHGIPNHMDRLRALGNAVCPQQAKEAFKILMGLKV